MISIGNLQINKLCLGDVAVSKAYLGDVEVYGLKPDGKYMTITVLDGESGTTISPTVIGALSPNLQYRINNGSWTDFVCGTTADIHLSAGNFVQFKGNNPNGISDSTSNYLNFDISGGDVTLSGNVMSLIDGVGETKVIPTSKNCFYNLFYESYSIKTVSSDFLPATTLASYCYYQMFYKCTSLTTAPELPATTLAGGCYSDMFAGCTSLTTAPALPATTVDFDCYNGMFQGCTSLVKAPELPATTLDNYCYQSMFAGCTSIVTAPELPATMLVPYCYYSMFRGCQNLNYVKCLATNVSSIGVQQFGSLKDWLSGVAATGTFVKPYGVSYPTGASGIPSGWTVVEEKPYMTMKVDKSAGVTTITPNLHGMFSSKPNLQYRVNEGDWNEYVFGQTGDIIASAGDVIQWKGNNQNGISTGSSKYLYFVISGLCNLSGNVMSLIDGVGESTAIPRNYCFYKLFSKSNVKTVSQGFLPATTLTNYCYGSMFSGCTSLTQAPELPATTLSDHCYNSMFSGCTSLTQAPELPATTLAMQCYNSMFQGCTSLTQSPSLPATTLVNRCYTSMFSGCTSLTQVPVLNANTLDEYCYNSMFQGCTSLTQAPELPATTLASGCYFSMFQGCTSLTQVPVLNATTLETNCCYSMFQGCTSLVKAPELPAKSLAYQCYYNMFKDCTSLTQAPSLPATTLDEYCYQSMFQGCTSLVKAPELPATTLVTYCYYTMFSGCTSLNYVKCLATDISASNALANWLQQVSPTGTFVKPAGVSYETGASGIPSGWTIEEI